MSLELLRAPLEGFKGYIALKHILPDLAAKLSQEVVILVTKYTEERYVRYVVRFYGVVQDDSLKPFGLLGRDLDIWLTESMPSGKDCSGKSEIIVHSQQLTGDPKLFDLHAHMLGAETWQTYSKLHPTIHPHKLNPSPPISQNFMLS